MKHKILKNPKKYSENLVTINLIHELNKGKKLSDLQNEYPEAYKNNERLLNIIIRKNLI
jgi:hypothetical protein